jgi:hypothetical protein
METIREREQRRKKFISREFSQTEIADNMVGGGGGNDRQVRSNVSDVWTS